MLRYVCGGQGTNFGSCVFLPYVFTIKLVGPGRTEPLNEVSCNSQLYSQRQAICTLSGKRSRKRKVCNHKGQAACAAKACFHFSFFF